MIGLPCGKKNYENMLSRFGRIPERDGRTDGQTDRSAISKSISRVSVLYCEGFMRLLQPFPVTLLKDKNSYKQTNLQTQAVRDNTSRAVINSKPLIKDALVQRKTVRKPFGLHHLPNSFRTSSAEQFNCVLPDDHTVVAGAAERNRLFEGKTHLKSVLRMFGWLRESGGMQ